MRKSIVVAALLLGVALVVGSPARADVGCGCVKLGQNPMCTATVEECVGKIGGLCLAPCDYQAPKMAKKHKKKM